MLSPSNPISNPMMKIVPFEVDFAAVYFLRFAAPSGTSESQADSAGEHGAMVNRTRGSYPARGKSFRTNVHNYPVAVDGDMG